MEESYENLHIAISCAFCFSLSIQVSIWLCPVFLIEFQERLQDRSTSNTLSGTDCIFTSTFEGEFCYTIVITPSVFDYVTLVPWPLLFQVKRDIIRYTINPCNFPLTIAICVSFLKFQVFDRGVHLFILVGVWIWRTS